MDYHFWVTTRTDQALRARAVRASLAADEFPPGLVGAYVLYAEDRDEVVGISIWDSAAACHRYRDSDGEARRQAVMDREPDGHSSRRGRQRPSVA
jgi:heme-degrading monooxygenase HmoA